MNTIIMWIFYFTYKGISILTLWIKYSDAYRMALKYDINMFIIEVLYRKILFTAAINKIRHWKWIARVGKERWFFLDSWSLLHHVISCWQDSISRFSILWTTYKAMNDSALKCVYLLFVWTIHIPVRHHR